MSIIKEKIYFNGNDSNIKINLGYNNDFFGSQQDTDKLIKDTANNLINPFIDSEKRKFKLSPSVITLKMQFYFNNALTFVNAGFKQNEIDLALPNILNSFFIFDYYDTYDTNIQTKIFTTYLTKIGKKPEYIVSAMTYNRLYNNGGHQLYYLYVPESYVTLVRDTSIIGYVKISFYNAKTGKISLFYNDVISPTVDKLSPELMYFKTELDFVNKTWNMLDKKNNVVIGKELINGALYNEKINNTYDNIDSKSLDYPTGGTYNYKTNKYI